MDEHDLLARVRSESEGPHVEREQLQRMICRARRCGGIHPSRPIRAALPAAMRRKKPGPSRMPVWIQQRRRTYYSIQPAGWCPRAVCHRIWPRGLQKRDSGRTWKLKNNGITQKEPSHGDCAQFEWNTVLVLAPRRRMAASGTMVTAPSTAPRMRGTLAARHPP